MLWVPSAEALWMILKLKYENPSISKSEIRDLLRSQRVCASLPSDKNLHRILINMRFNYKDMDSMSCKEKVDKEKSHEPRSLKSLAFDAKDSNGNNLLHRFVLNNCYTTENIENYTNAVLRSISGVPSVNARNSDGYTALHLAVREHSYFMVRKLISLVPTIDVNIKSLHGGKTALHLAAALSSGDGEDATTIIKYLLSSGADLNAEDVIFDRPLVDALKNRNLKTVKVLIESGADLDYSNIYGQSHLHVAVGLGRIEIVKALIEAGAHSYNNEIWDDDGDFPLHVAVKGGYLEIVNVLIECGTDVDIHSKAGDLDTPIHKAVKGGYFEILNALIEAGANVDEPNRCGTPLLLAVERGHFEIVRALLKGGADVDICNKDGDTPLHVATIKGCCEIVEALIKGGADIRSAKKFCRSWDHLNIRYF